MNSFAKYIRDPYSERNMEDVNLAEKIRGLPEYVSFAVSPRRIRNPESADKAVHLLDIIHKITGQEYVFLHVQQSCLGSSCSPAPQDYNPTNAVNHVLGRYDRQYFVDLAHRLRNQ